MPKVTARVIFNRLPEKARGLQGIAQMIVMKTANDIMGTATTTAPRVTGHLAGSNSVVPIGPTEYEVQNTAEYAAYVNFGTRYQRANPFFTNAAERHRASFSQAMGAAIKAFMES